MTLPMVIEFGRFDRFNGCMCTVAFAAKISNEEQQRLQSLTDSHNRTSPGNSEKPRFYLAFKGNQIQFCRVPATDAPTRVQFDALLEVLGIANPSETESGSQPSAATLPKTKTDDAHRAA